MNIESKINSYEYKCKLNEHLSLLLRKTKSAINEASTASAFHTEIYYFIRDFFNIEPDYTPEVNQTILRHKFIGRMDAVCNNLIIEYKKVGKLDKAKDIDNATTQLSNYIKQLFSETNYEYYGILTDGIKIRYVYFQEGEIHSTPLKNLDENDLDKLVRSLIDVNNKRFVPQNIVQDFKINSVNLLSLNLAKFLFNKLNCNFTGKTAMLFQEWKTLFHLSENDKGQNEDIAKRRKSLGNLFQTKISEAEDDYKALFALQTTYAIIVKLIACKVVTKLAFNKNIEYFEDLSSIDTDTLREFLQFVEDGYVFQTGGVKNLLEGDFFSWYCSEDIWNEDEAEIIKGIISTLEGYSNSFYVHGYMTKDIFIDLYMEIMPAEVRHSLGEYFTPEWLASYVVDSSLKELKKTNFSAIDPCCGSGVFIISIIKKIIGKTDINSLTEKEKRTLLFSIIERVKGVDINPLSVLTAKVSFYISIKPLVNNENIEIPIYLGDSANIPKKVMLDNLDCYEYTITTKQYDINVVLPSVFVENKDFFSMMGDIQKIIKSGESTLVYSKFLDSIGEHHLNDEAKARIFNLSEQLSDLHNKKWDGIWIRIVANFMLVGRIKNVDLVIGNPPWVKWEFLPQEYASKIKNLCIERHLFSGQTYMGAISLNICALIANVTASSWLSKNGILAFLMPQTLMTQDSYAGFRNFYINNGKRMYLQKLDDWTKSGNPFIDTTEKFMTYYYRNKTVNYFKDGIPIQVIKKKKGISIKEINQKHSFLEVEEYFEFSKAKAFQLDKERTGYTTVLESSLKLKNKFDLIMGKCEYKARSGVEFTPAEIYFIEPLEETSNPKTYKFMQSKFKNSKYKSISNLPIVLETKFVKPVIKAPNIIPFGFKQNNNYCIFPYEVNKSISIEPILLSKKSPELLNYLINSKKLIEKQSKRSKSISRGNSFYSLSKVGDYTFSPNLVTFRDNTKLSAAVVEEEVTPWGDKVMPICAKHCPYISQDKEGRNITSDEAYYLCGILNTPIVQEYFKSTYSTRSYSINFNIKMPLYDKGNTNHVKIMKLSRKATKFGVNDILITEIENTYLDLCKET